MDIAFSPEHLEFRRTVRDFLSVKSPEAEVRRLMATTDGFDAELWRGMSDSLGLQGLAIPEEFGGSGFTFVELGIVLEEMGRVLLCAPFFSTAVLASSTLLLSGDRPAQRDFLPGLAGGDIGALALVEDGHRWDAQGVHLAATRSGQDWTLSGTKKFVLDGHTADLILVAARTAGGDGPEGISIFAVAGDAAGLVRTPLATLDPTRKQAQLTFDRSPARLVGEEGDGWRVVTQVLDLASIALAAEQVGGAERVLDMSVDYAKIRVQFGHPIGSFQAVKHKCADMLMAVESARSAVCYGLRAAAEPTEELPQVASLVKAYCSDAYVYCAAENIQIHGGIGFTWEHPAHLYFKRAKSSQLLFGDSAYHRELLAQRLGV